MRLTRNILETIFCHVRRKCVDTPRIPTTELKVSEGPRGSRSHANKGQLLFNMRSLDHLQYSRFGKDWRNVALLNNKLIVNNVFFYAPLTVHFLPWPPFKVWWSILLVVFNYLFKNCVCLSPFFYMSSIYYITKPI